MLNALGELGIQCESQVNINGAQTDIALTDYPIVIECDGVYWHSLPKARAQDAHKTQLLEGAGYQVLRFWGDEIKSNIGGCLKEVLYALDYG